MKKKHIITGAVAFLSVLPLMACGNSGPKAISISSAIDTASTALTSFITDIAAIDPTTPEGYEAINTKLNGGATVNANITLNKENILDVTEMIKCVPNMFELNAPEAFLSANLQGSKITVYSKNGTSADDSYSYINTSKDNYNAKVKTSDFGTLMGMSGANNGGGVTTTITNNLALAPAYAAIQATGIATSTPTQTPSIGTELEGLLEVLKAGAVDPMFKNTATTKNLSNGGKQITLNFDAKYIANILVGTIAAMPDNTFTTEELMDLANSLSNEIKSFNISIDLNKNNSFTGLSIAFNYATKISGIDMNVSSNASVKLGANIPEMSTELQNAALIDVTNDEHVTEFQTTILNSIKGTVIGDLILASNPQV